MKTIITTHPIDVGLLKSLNTYDDSSVPSISVGKVLGALIKAGYKQVNSYVVESGTNCELRIHLKKVPPC